MLTGNRKNLPFILSRLDMMLISHGLTLKVHARLEFVCVVGIDEFSTAMASALFCPEVFGPIGAVLRASGLAQPFRLREENKGETL